MTKPYKKKLEAEIMKSAKEEIPDAIREQIERFMADPERCLPSERAYLETLGFKPAKKEPTNGD